MRHSLSGYTVRESIHGSGRKTARSPDSKIKLLPSAARVKSTVGANNGSRGNSVEAKKKAAGERQQSQLPEKENSSAQEKENVSA